jgi:hypothetical protein
VLETTDAGGLLPQMQEQGVKIQLDRVYSR